MKAQNISAAVIRVGLLSLTTAMCWGWWSTTYGITVSVMYGGVVVLWCSGVVGLVEQ